MSHDFGPVVEKARVAVRAAYNDFRSLHAAVSDTKSIPVSLQFAGNTLDKLAQNFDLMARSTSALSSEVAQQAFNTRMSDDVKLSDAILHDMTAISSCLRLMTPSTSLEPVMIMEEIGCRDIANMAARYDQAISSILLYHNSCVRSLTATTILCSPQRRSSLDVLIGGIHAVREDMNDIRRRLHEQEGADLRNSTK
jgi:hypothetical protein